MLARIFGPVIAGTRGWRTVHNEKLHALLPFLPHIIGARGGAVG
jgi:hypothetical protein